MTTGRRALDRHATEAQLQRTVIEMAQALHWMVHHTPRATVTRRDGGKAHFTPTVGNPGWPDLALAHPRHGLLLLELKTERGQLSTDQRDWHDVLRAGGARVYLIRPRDLNIVERILRGDAP